MKRDNNLGGVSILGLWILFFILFEVCTGFLRGIASLWIDSEVAYIKIFILTFLVLRKWRKEFIPFFIALHVFYCIIPLIALYQYLISGQITIAGWFNFLTAILGGWSAYFLVRSKTKTLKASVLGLSLLMIPLIYFNYKYIRYFNSFSSFTYVRDIPVNSNKYYLTNSMGEKVNLEKDVVYIMDFWNTGCGYCFRGFPDFDKKKKENTDPGIKYVSVNFPLERDSAQQAFEVMKKYHYSFPVLKGSEKINEAFGVKAYPTIIALRNDTILYKGNFKRLDDFLNDYSK